MSWEKFFHQAGIPAAAAHRYSQSFMKNRIKETDLPDLDRETLGQLGIQAIGDQLTILRHIKSGKTTKPAPKPSGSMRVRITTETQSLDHTAASTHRKGRPPPDRNEIYHIKMPEGSTERSRKILRQAKFARPEGVRGTTGVRQAGRPVSPIDKKSVAVKSMQKTQTSSHPMQIVRKHLDINTKKRNTDKTLTVVPPHKNAQRTIVQKKVGVATTAGNRVITRTIEKPDRNITRVSIGSRVTNRVSTRPSVHNRITFSNSNNQYDEDMYEEDMDEDVVYEGEEDNMDDNLYSEEDNGYVEYVEMPRRSIYDRISQ